jgi:hypothetical protein
VKLPECRRKTSTSLDTGDGLVTCTGPVTGVVLRTPGPAHRRCRIGIRASAVAVIAGSGLNTLGDTLRAAVRRYSPRYYWIEPFEYSGSISVAPR